MSKPSKSEVQAMLVAQLPTRPHCLAKLPMRAGKTKIGIDLIKRDKPKKILWVTVSTKLRDIDIPGEFVKWKAKTYLKKTKIVCYNSLHKVKGHYDMIILDECQSITKSNMKNIINGELSCTNILGMTGTLPASRDKWEIFNHLGLKVQLDISIEEAIQLGLIAEYEIKVLYTPLDEVKKSIRAGSKEKPFYTTERANYDYMTSWINGRKSMGKPVPFYKYLNRSKFVKNLPSKIRALNKLLKDPRVQGRRLVFVDSIEEANKFPHHYHSKTDDKSLNLFLEGKIDTLVCVNAGSVGFTYRDVDHFIISCIDSNAMGNPIQKFGRALVPQEGYKGSIFMLIAQDTVEQQWLENVLEDLEPSRIKHYSYEL